MRTLGISVGLLPLALIAAACDVEEPVVDSTSDELTATDGLHEQGIRLNGIRLNGIRLNGIRLNGIRLNGTVVGATLVGSQLQGTLKQGMVGAELTAELSDGSTRAFRIKSAAVDPMPGNSDVWLYEIEMQDAVPQQQCYKGGFCTTVYVQTWTPVCEGTNRAVAVSGTYGANGTHTASSTLFTFSCLNGVIAKCVQWGYKPWKVLAVSAKGSSTLLPYHRSCTRMAMADYYGNGSSFTADGNVIDVEDRAGVQVMTDLPWIADGLTTARHNRYFEGVWDEHGPVCLKTLRMSSCGQFNLKGTDCNLTSLIAAAQYSHPRLYGALINGQNGLCEDEVAARDNFRIGYIYNATYSHDAEVMWFPPTLPGGTAPNGSALPPLPVYPSP